MSAARRPRFSFNALKRVAPGLVSCALVAGVLLALPTVARAQQFRGSPMLDETRNTLAFTLARMRWNAAGKGPLLVLDPENTYGVRGRQQYPVPLLPDTGDRPLPVRAVTDHFGLREFAVGTLSVLAPAEMVLLNTAPDRPDPTEGLRPHERAARFFASLTRTQWRQAGGLQGIGLADLSRQQRPLFRALLPEDVTVRKAVYAESNGKQSGTNGGVRYSIEGHWPGDRFRRPTNDPPATLSPAQRGAVRLQLRRVPLARVGFRGSAAAPLRFGPLRDHVGQTFYRLEETHGGGTDTDVEKNGTVYGVTLKRRVPNRPKAGHLAFDAPVLDRTVALGGAATVADLLKRIGGATGLELVADARVATLPVWVSGPDATARAGDVLKALCLCVTGTFRRVGPVYLLTQDVEGIAPRVRRLTAWASDAARQLEAERREFARRAVRERYADALAHDTQDGLVLTDGVKAALARTRRGASGRWPAVPASALDGANRALLRRMAEMVEASAPLDLTEIRVEEQVAVSFVVPGVAGPVRADHLASALDFLTADPRGEGDEEAPDEGPEEEETADRPVPLPPALKNRVLAVPVEVLAGDAARAGRLLAAAKRRGVTAVWAAVSADGAEAAALSRAVTAGRKAGVPVGALVRLMTAPDGLPDGQKDRGLWGQAVASGAAWRRPDLPETRAALRGRLAALAKVPGLAALAFTDSAPPGYVAPAPRGGQPTPPWDESFFLGDDSRTVGYTPELRLAYLRENGVDPLDLTGRHDAVRALDLALPFFTDDRYLPIPPADGERRPMFRVDGEYLIAARSDVRGRPTDFDSAREGMKRFARWREMRADVNRRLLADLHADLRRAAPPNLPLFLQDRGGPEDVAVGYAAWVGSPPPDGPTARRRPNRLDGYRVLEPPPPPPRVGEPPPFAAHVKSAAKWGGFVLDLSRLPPDRTLPVLESLIAVK